MSQFLSKYKKLSYINLYLISILPIGLLIGSFISNLIIVLIVIFFLLDLKKKNNFFFLNDTNFYFLLLINLYLILNSIFISENTQSLLKAIGFLRFIILTYAIYFYFQLWKTEILRFWFIIFIVVTIDIIFELILGFNLIGNETIFKGRIASFTGDELKIGGYYFGFILLSLIFVEEKKKYFIVLSIIFFFVAMLIGERSNFLKIFTMYFLFILFFTNLKFYKKIILIFIIFLSFTLMIFSVSNLKSKFVNQIFNERLFMIVDSYDDFNYLEIVSKSQYLSHYYISYKIFNENKFFGSGFKSFRIESRKKEYQEKNIYGASTHPHQIHFEILSELGIIGYTLIFTNLLYILFSQIKYRKNNLNRSAILFIIATLIPILPSGSFFTSYVATIFFINYSFLIRPNLLNNVNKKQT